METIEYILADQLRKELRILDAGKNRFKVWTPFQYSNRHTLFIFTIFEKNRWVLSDERKTYKNVEFKIKNKYGYLPQDKVIENILKKFAVCIDSILKEFDVINKGGELIITKIEDWDVSFFRFCQALILIDDIDSSQYL